MSCSGDGKLERWATMSASLESKGREAELCDVAVIQAFYAL